MRDGRPNPDIWGNIITCGEIAVGIYEIVGTKKRGLEVPKALAEEILPESVMEQAAQDGENLCFTDPVSNAIVADALLEQELVTDPQAAARLDAIRQLDDVAYDTVWNSLGKMCRLRRHPTTCLRNGSMGRSTGRLWRSILQEKSACNSMT